MDVGNNFDASNPTLLFIKDDLSFKRKRMDPLRQKNNKKLKVEENTTLNSFFMESISQSLQPQSGQLERVDRDSVEKTAALYEQKEGIVEIAKSIWQSLEEQ